MTKKVINYPIIKKAWAVLDPTYSFWLECPWQQEAEIVYARTRNAAKREITNIDWSKSGYLNIKSTRAKEYDIVLFRGKDVKRSNIAVLLAREERQAKIQALPEDELYYVQDARQYVGNSMLWHALGGGGYTTDLNNAHKHTKADIVKFQPRDTDVIWQASHVNANTKVHVDMQYVSRSFSV